MGKGKKHPADAQRAKEKEKQKKRNYESRKMVKVGRGTAVCVVFCATH